MFLGWYLQPGGKWTGDYLCVALADLCAEVPKTGAHIHRIREVVLPEVVTFPMRAARQQALLDRVRVQVESGLPPIPPLEVDEELGAEVSEVFDLLGPGPEQPSTGSREVPADSEAGEDLRPGLGLSSSSSGPAQVPGDTGAAATKVYLDTTRPHDVPTKTWAAMQWSVRKACARIWNQEQRVVIPKRFMVGQAAMNRPVVVASPAVASKLRYMLEACCDEDSMFGRIAGEFGCVLDRITKREDLMSDKGFSDAIRFAHDHPGCDLWGSLPCTPWSVWQT